MKNNQSCAVLGAGAFGSALSHVFLDSGFRVRLFGTSKELDSESVPAEAQKQVWNFESELSFEGETLWIVLAVPSKALRKILSCLRLPRAAKLVLVSKGLEPESHLLPFQVLETLQLHHPYVVLSGPTFAFELEQKKLSATTLASKNLETALELARAFQKSFVRGQVSSDVIGVSLAGVGKNIIAIASGASDALELGHNARAALITVGLQEIAQLTHAMGGQPETFLSFAGIGDLILTAVGDRSRNRQLGRRLILEPERSDAFLSGHTCEGALAVQGVFQLCKQFNVRTSLIRALKSVLEQKLSMPEALKRTLQEIAF